MRWYYDRSCFIRNNILTFICYNCRSYYSICLNYTSYNFKQIDNKKTHLYLTVRCVFYIYNWQTTFVDSPFPIFIIIKFIEKVNKNFNFSYFLFLLFESILIYKYKKRVVTISSYYFLVDRDGFGEPRRENSLPDYFLILLFEPSAINLLLLNYSKLLLIHLIFGVPRGTRTPIGRLGGDCSILLSYKHICHYYITTYFCFQHCIKSNFIVNSPLLFPAL